MGFVGADKELRRGSLDPLLISDASQESERQPQQGNAIWAGLETGDVLQHGSLLLSREAKNRQGFAAVRKKRSSEKLQSEPASTHSWDSYEAPVPNK